MDVEIDGSKIILTKIEKILKYIFITIVARFYDLYEY